LLVLGVRKFELPWLVCADALAALTVAAVSIVGWIAVGERTLDALLDAAPNGYRYNITTAIGQMDASFACGAGTIGGGRGNRLLCGCHV